MQGKKWWNCNQSLSLDLAEPDRKSIAWPQSHPSNTINALHRILQLHLESSKPSSHQTQQFRPCKILPNATPRSMQKRQIRKIIDRTPRFGGLAFFIKPPVRIEFKGILTPEFLVGVSRPGRGHDHG